MCVTRLENRITGQTIATSPVPAFVGVDLDDYSNRPVVVWKRVAGGRGISIGCNVDARGEYCSSRMVAMWEIDVRERVALFSI